MLDEWKKQLAARKFSISLPRCELRQCSTDPPLIYTGSGFIDQQEDGSLLLRMFSDTKVDAADHFRRLFGPGPAPGVLLPAGHYYDLEASDQRGGRWRAAHLSLDEKFGVGCEIHARIRRLERVETIKKTPSRSASWFIPQVVELPWHETSTKENGGWSLDRFEGEDEAFAWKIVKVDGGIEVSFTVKSGPLEPHATNFLRALAMLVGRAMEPRVSCQAGDGEIISRIHDKRPNERARLTEPMELRIHEASGAHQFLARCLHLESRQPRDVSDPLKILYQFWHRILRAHQEDIENSSLVLSVAIEGTLKELFHSEYDVDLEFAALVRDALPAINSMAVDERVRQSLRKSVEHASAPKTKDTLHRLVEQGAITREHVAAWNRMRHAGAHGDLLDDDHQNIQKHLDRYFCCLGLFYRLIFLAIGYRGKHSDFSVNGWPDSMFPPEASAEVHETTPEIVRDP